jgi:hypothetical protein
MLIGISVLNFEQLVEYKRTHGNCNVPRNYELNKELGHWISSQRCLEGKDSLQTDRVTKLDSIGFHFAGQASQSDG